MPVGTVTRNTERFDLKSLPGGYVVIRRMNYGEKLERQDSIMDMSMAMGDNKQFAADVKILNKQAALQDFANLVIEHNITDEQERLLSFKVQRDVLLLDPIIGEEIGSLIDKLNSFEETEEVKN